MTLENFEVNGFWIGWWNNENTQESRYLQICAPIGYLQCGLTNWVDVGISGDIYKGYTNYQFLNGWMARMDKTGNHFGAPDEMVFNSPCVGGYSNGVDFVCSGPSTIIINNLGVGWCAPIFWSQGAHFILNGGGVELNGDGYTAVGSPDSAVVIC